MKRTLKPTNSKREENKTIRLAAQGNQSKIKTAQPSEMGMPLASISYVPEAGVNILGMRRIGIEKVCQRSLLNLWLNKFDLVTLVESGGGMVQEWVVGGGSGETPIAAF